MICRRTCHSFSIFCRFSAFLLFSLCFLLFSFCSSFSFAAIVGQPSTGCFSNGHYYQLVDTPATYSTALTTAANMVYNGMRGYLATVTTVEENTLIRGLLTPGTVGGPKYYWLGGTANTVAAASITEYLWETGPEAGTSFWRKTPETCLTYCDWGTPTGKPDGPTGNSRKVAITVSPAVDGWDDRSSTAPPVAAYPYIVEYGGICENAGETDCTCDDWSENCFLGGHTYQLNTTSGVGFNYSAAKNFATTTVQNGKTGYLATITSEDENTYVKGMLSYGDLAWAGAIYIAGTWTWDGGPELGDTFENNDTICNSNGHFCNWGSNSPVSGALTIEREFASAWDNSNIAIKLKSYIVEFGDDCAVAGCNCGTPTPSRTPTRSASKSRTPSISSTLSITSSYSPTPSRTVTPSNSGSSSASPSGSPSSSVTPSKSASPSISPSLTASTSLTATISVSPSVTPTYSVTPSFTPTISTSGSFTPTISFSASITPSPSVTPSFSTSSSLTPSNTPSSSITPSSSASSSVTSSVSLTPSVTPSFSASSSVTLSVSLTPSSTTSISPSSSISLSSSVTPSLSATLSGSPTSSVTPSSSVTVSLSSTVSLTHSITSSVSRTPAVSRSRDRTKRPSTPTPSKTHTPTPTLTPDIDDLDNKGCLLNPERCPIKDSNYTITEKDTKKNITIPIIGKGGVIWGEAVIPPHTFPAGCEIHVSQGAGASDQKKSNNNGCNSDKVSTVIPGSIQLNLTLNNCGDVQEDKFPNPIELRIIGQYLATDEETCIGFVQDREDEWECAEFLKVLNSTDAGAIFSTFVDHFTSFAVLFFPSDGGSDAECVSWGWISITSIVMIGSCFFLVILVMISHVVSPTFRSIVSGEQAIYVRKAQIFASRVADYPVVNESSFLELTTGGVGKSISPMASPTVVTFGAGEGPSVFVDWG